jgi:hypothetical protein
LAPARRTRKTSNRNLSRRAKLLRQRGARQLV